MSTTDDKEGFPFPESAFSDRSIGRRQDDVIRALSYFDLKLKGVEKESEQARLERAEFRKWIETDKERSAWYYANRNHLESIVEGSKWASTTRKVVMLIAGTILGSIMFFQAIWPFFEGKFKP